MTAESQNRIQGMLCARIDALEEAIEASAIQVDSLHVVINVMENRRTIENECKDAATHAREMLRAIVGALESALKGDR